MYDSQPTLPLRLITYNIRYDAAPPNRSPSEAPWRLRAPHIARTLLFHTREHPSALIHLQEALHHQLTDLLALLNTPPSTAPSTTTTSTSTQPSWAYLGVGRDDGLTAGEFAPILYRPSVWHAEQWRTVWLSETPDIPGSKGWDAASVRIATVAVLAHGGCRPRRRIVAINTHLDNEGAAARREGARMVVSLAEEWSSRGVGRARIPCVVAGDLNSEPGGEAHRVLDDGGAASLLADVRGLAAQEMWYGDRATFTGFEGREDEQQVLDFVFVGPRTSLAWRAEMYAVLPSVFEDGIMHSDHRAVVADLDLLA